MSPIKKNGSPRGSSHIQSLEGDLSQRKREEISLRQIMAKRGRLRYHCRLLPGSLSHTTRLLPFRRAPSFSSRHSHVTLSLWPDTVYYIQIDLVTATSELPPASELLLRPEAAVDPVPAFLSSYWHWLRQSKSAARGRPACVWPTLRLRRHHHRSVESLSAVKTIDGHRIPLYLMQPSIVLLDSSTCRSFITENPIIRIIASPLLAILSSWYK